MALIDINTIKNWFKTGMIPTQEQFWSLFDSYRHKNDKVPVADVEGINELLATRASKQVLDNHMAQKGAPNGYAPLDEFTKLAAQYLNIVNDLVTGGSSALLSAEQGKVLQTQISAINTLLTSDNVNLDTVQELVDAIETVQLSLSTILVNDLTTGGITKALTAEMGRTLKSLIDGLQTVVTDIDDDQIEVSGNVTMQPSWNKKTILITGNSTITVPDTLLAKYGFPWYLLPGVSLSWAITAPFTWGMTAPTTITGGTEGVYGVLNRRGSTNTIYLGQ